jgi:glycosyltransferase involved in cell wall biosynthesis
MSDARWSIVHVLSSYGVGGQERVALDLAAGQVERGHDVHVVSLAGEPDGPLATEFTAAGVAVHRVARKNRLDPALVVKLARVLRRLGADVVHTHNPLPLIYGAPAARLIGAAAVHTKHGRNPGSRIERVLRRGAARLVGAFVAVSETTAAQAREQRDCPAAVLSVIPNGIQLGRFRPDPAVRAAVRAELGIPADAWVVGTVGRIDEFKNQGMLIEAAASRVGDSYRVVLVGDGPLREALATQAAAIGPWVQLTGRRMDVERLLPAFDVFALPSKSEGLPLVVPEAMAAGLPVIATSVGGLPDVVDEGVTGLLIPVDVAALSTALDTLSADRPRAREMGSRAREVALRRYAADRMLDEYMALYRALRKVFITSPTPR